VRVEPRFNIAPTQEVLIVVDRAPRLATWGFTPPWLRGDGRRRPPPINARAETLGSNPMFREALLARRCLVVADGFYEWPARSPMYIRLKRGGLFAFAGLWAPGKAGGPPSVAIVTTRPNELVAPIHNRMPVILRPEDEAASLDPHQNDLARLTAMLSPLDPDRMEAYPVAPLVNAFQNEGPELIAPLPPE
jgi:putative SOS response-associated peptidase YedK